MEDSAVVIWTLVLSGIAAFATPISVWAIWLAKRADKRATEVQDIIWAYKECDDGFLFRHFGRNAARNVTIQLTFDDEPSTEKLLLVEPEEDVLVPNTKYQRNREANSNKQFIYDQELEEYEKQRVDGLLFEQPDAVQPLGPFLVSGDVKVIITWQYPSGQPGHQEFAWKS